MAYTVLAKTFSAYRGNVGTVGKQVMDWIVEQSAGLFSYDSKTGAVSATEFNAYLKYKNYPMGINVNWSSHSYFYHYVIKNGSYGLQASDSSYRGLFYFTEETNSKSSSITVKILRVGDFICVSVYTAGSPASGWFCRFGEFKNIYTGNVHGALRFGNRGTYTGGAEAYVGEPGYVYMPDKDEFYGLSLAKVCSYFSGKIADLDSHPNVCFVEDPYYYSNFGVFQSSGLLEKVYVLNSGVKIDTSSDIPVQIGTGSYLCSLDGGLIKVG